MKKLIKRPERGPVPIAKTIVDLNTDVDVLTRRIGEVAESAATVEDLANAGIVTRATDGSLTANPQAVGGPQGLYDFLKGYQ